jgi:hypothetical protein
MVAFATCPIVGTITAAPTASAMATIATVAKLLLFIIDVVF